MLWIVGAGMVLLAAVLLVQDRARAVAAGQGEIRARGHRVAGDVAAGLCVGGGLLLMLAFSGRAYGNGQLISCLPALMGAVLLAVFTAIEGTWPQPRGTVRSASTRVRDVSTLGLGGLRWLSVAWTIAIVAASTVLAVVASSPREVSRPVGDGQVLVAAPFPGWWYALPVIISTTVLAAWTRGVLALVVSRPAVEGLGVEQDLALRHRSARRILASTQLALSLTLAGQLALAASAFRSLGLGEGGTGTSVLSAPGSGTYQALGLALGALAVVIALAGFVACFLPARSTRPRRELRFAGARP